MKWNPDWRREFMAALKSGSLLLPFSWQQHPHVSSICHPGERSSSPVKQWHPKTSRREKGDQMIWFFYMFCHGRAAALTLKWDRQSRWGPHSEPLLNADGLSRICATQTADRYPDIEQAHVWFCWPTHNQTCFNEISLTSRLPQIHFKTTKTRLTPVQHSPVSPGASVFNFSGG